MCIFGLLQKELCEGKHDARVENLVLCSHILKGEGGVTAFASLCGQVTEMFLPQILSARFLKRQQALCIIPTWSEPL